jgi:hypothetical protein
LQAGQRLAAVAGGRDDVEALPGERVRQHPAHQRESSATTTRRLAMASIALG